MAIKHGVALPTGITATGVLVHSLKTSAKDVAIKSYDETDQLVAIKSKRVDTTFDVSGEMLSTAALPEAGTGEGSLTEPHIEGVDVEDKFDAASTFTIQATASAEGAGDVLSPA